VASAKPARREKEPQAKFRMIFPGGPGVFADRARIMSRKDFILFSFTQVFELEKEDFLGQVAAQVYMPIGDARRLLTDLQEALAGTEKQDV